MTIDFEELIKDQETEEKTIKAKDLYVGQVFTKAINHLGASLDLDAEGDRLYEDQFVDFAWQVVNEFVRIGEYTAVRESIMKGVEDSTLEVKKVIEEYLDANHQH